jgi:hypothetical protein
LKNSDHIQKKQLTADEILAKKGRADYFSTNYKVALSNANQDSPLKDRYIYSTFCASKLVKTGDKITSLYCGQRWCVTCNRIRTAELINAYYPEISQLEDPRFITLTLKNCKEDELRDRIIWMNKTWAKIQKKIYRNKSIKGYRKLEVTHNLRYNDFHPHFHAIVNKRENSQYIISEWIKLVKEAGIEVSADFQDDRPADIKSMLELFKYTTKILPTKKKGQKYKDMFARAGSSKRFLKGQDFIYQALVRVRTFQPFGFKPIKDVQEDKVSVQSVEIDSNAPDGQYVRTGRGNWNHILYDTPIHTKQMHNNSIILVNAMGGMFIKKLAVF